MNLNHSQFAKAIECVTKLNPENSNNKHYWDEEYHSFIYDKIKIDKHISITIPCYYHLYKSGLLMGFYVISNCIFLDTDMYVDNIKVNHYEFEKELEEGHINTNIWELEKKEIYHKLPYEIIHKINEWSYNIIESYRIKEYNNNLEKKQKEQLKFETEEKKLSKIFKKYKKE